MWQRQAKLGGTCVSCSTGHLRGRAARSLCGHVTVEGQEFCGYDRRGSSYLGGGLQFAIKLFLMHYLIGFSQQSCEHTGRSYYTDEETWKVEVISFRG